MVKKNRLSAHPHTQWIGFFKKNKKKRGKKNLPQIINLKKTFRYYVENIFFFYLAGLGGIQLTMYRNPFKKIWNVSEWIFFIFIYFIFFDLGLFFVCFCFCFVFPCLYFQYGFICVLVALIFRTLCSQICVFLIQNFYFYFFFHCLGLSSSSAFIFIFLYQYIRLASK